MGVVLPFTLTTNCSVLTYEESIFPGGEVFIRLNDNQRIEDKDVLICASVMSSDDLMKILMMTDALREAHARSISLYMPYVPYARQDRVCNPGEAHSIRVFGDLINSQKYKDVIVFDPHSDVTGAVIKNITIIDNNKFIRIALTGTKQWGDSPIPFKSFVLISPDAGALKKVSNLAKYLIKHDVPISNLVQADKLRDLKTGKIIKTLVHTEDLKGADCIIVDDICDGGRTFIDLAAALKAKNAGRIALIVSHGIFSKGIKNLQPNIDYVIYSDSVNNKNKNMWDGTIHDGGEVDNIVYKMLPIRRVLVRNFKN